MARLRDLTSEIHTTPTSLNGNVYLKRKLSKRNPPRAIGMSGFCYHHHCDNHSIVHHPSYLDDVGYLKRKLSKRNPPGAIGKSGGLTIPDTVARRQNESDLKRWWLERGKWWKKWCSNLFSIRLPAHILSSPAPLRRRRNIMPCFFRLYILLEHLPTCYGIFGSI